jgi:hypothetical protein
MSMGPGAFRANAPALDVDAIEHDLARIPAVTSARVIVANEQVDEVHIVCGSGRAPKLINRDVQSLLAARWGVDVDHRKVSVVQLTDEEIDLRGGSLQPSGEPAPAVSEVTRFRVAEVSISVSDDNCEATVTVAAGDRRASGRATGIPSLDGQRRAGAGAALVALANLDQPVASFGVSDVAAVEVGGERTIVISVTAWRDGAERALVGAATVGPLGELRAAAEAVLRAFS